MYENQRSEYILQRKLAHVLGENPDLDTREGSIVYNALAPTAVEQANMYVQLDTVLKETFADTSSRYYLIKRAAERGVYPKPATNAILHGEFNMPIPLGTRFSHETLNYVAYEAITPTTYRMLCETPGSAGNRYLGQLIPIEYINGLTLARITELLIPGDDEEDTEVFRQRYFDSIDSKAFGGNIADYKEKTLALQGVGGVKVNPVWNGGGTVKVVVMDSTYSVPSETLVAYVQEELDPEGEVPDPGSGGGGRVQTVNNIEPDDNGNVDVTARDILLDSGASVEKGIADLGTAVSGVGAQMELIANENMSINPLIPGATTNQRGLLLYNTVGQYTVDRKQLISGSCSVTGTGNNCVMTLNGIVREIIENPAPLAGMPFTASVENAEVSIGINGVQTPFAESVSVILPSTLTSLFVDVRASNTIPAWLQLIRGTKRQSRSMRLLGEELALCQRYYEKSYNINDAPGTSVNNGMAPIVTPVPNILTQIPGQTFKVSKRINANVTIYAHDGVKDKVTAHNVGNAIQSVTNIGLSGMIGFGFIELDSALSAANGYTYQWTADAEIY